MTVDEFASELRSPMLQFVHEGWYTNSLGQVGYRAIYRSRNLYLSYRVSSTEIPFVPDEVVMAITANTRWIQRENPYLNRKGKIGFEATVLSGGHAFMLGSSDRGPRFF